VAEPGSPAAEVPVLVDRLFRRTRSRLVAGVVRVLGPGRIDLAEDAVQDAMVRALRTWPFRGIPEDPAAWLMRTARNRAIDMLRRDRTGHEAQDRLVVHLELLASGGRAEDEADGRHLLELCSTLPLAPDALVPLVLHVMGGLSAREIARALLLPEATVAQRIVRGKRVLRGGGVGPARRTPRNEAVIHQVIYLMLTEGHTPADADEVLRTEVAREALRLALLLASGRGATPASHALAALCCLTVARFPARESAGDLVMLPSQDRSRWDTALVEEGFRQLTRAASGDTPSRYHFEAAIAAEHVRAATLAETNWDGIVDLYHALETIDPSPVVRLNRAIALAMAGRNREGLAVLDALSAEGQLAEWPWFHASRAWLLHRTGLESSAASHLWRAMALGPPAAHRRLLERGFDAPREDPPSS